MSLLVAIALALSVSAVFLAVGTMTGLVKAPRKIVVRGPSTLQITGGQILASISLAAIVGFVTGWPVAVAAALVAPVVVPPILKPSSTKEQLDRLEAFTDWIEGVRDQLSAASGLEGAIIRSAASAPPAIAAEGRRLAQAMSPPSSLPTGDALRAFADDLNDARADNVLAPLIMAVEANASGVAGVLSDLARAGRAEVTMWQKIEARRSPGYSQMRVVVIFSIVALSAITILGQGYMAPFGSLTGQVVMALAFGLYAVGLVWMLRMLRPPVMMRILVKR